MTDHQFLLEMRRLLLAALDLIERKANLAPRTKEIRDRHKRERKAKSLT